MRDPKLLAGLVLTGLLALPSTQARADDLKPFAGSVWDCAVTRPDSSVFPVYAVFHSDRTVRQSSGSDIYNAGYSGRGGLQGSWRARKDLGADIYQARFVEILWRNVDESTGFIDGGQPIAPGFRDVAAGRFFVNQVLYHYVGSDGLEHLCSGPVGCEGSGVPQAVASKVAIRLKRLPLDCQIGQPCDNFNVASNARCTRLEDTFPDLGHPAD